MSVKGRSQKGVLILIWAILLAACGPGPEADPPSPLGSSTEGAEEGADPPEEHGEDDLENMDRPPPVTVRFADDSMELDAWTYCFGNVCADGAPPKNPPDVGSPEEVIVEFPLDDWSFDASFTPAGEKCGREQSVRLEETPDGNFQLRPIGHPDTYDVTLFGRGNGDLFVSFRWTTGVEGPLDRPSARLAVLADHDGKVDSYGVELQLTNLAATPEKAYARVTVEASDGNSLTFGAKPSRRTCFPEGTLYWDGPDGEGLAAADLGEPPFTYEVDVFLDGELHRATATWPDDEIKGNEPSVALDFTPPLPAQS